MEYKDKVESWFGEHEDLYKEMIEPEYRASQICAIMFLYSKMKEDNLDSKYLLQAEHDVLYLGELDSFEELSEGDIKKLISYGVIFNCENESFFISASM